MTDLQRLNQIFDRAASIEDPEQRAAYLDDACADQPALRARIEALLDQDARDRTPLDAPLDDLVVDLLGSDDTHPDRIGAFRVEREVGRGGMGTVYLGHRDDGAFDQTVAIKVVNRGMDTDEILARFASERRILAGLDHAGIARLLDGGALEDGRPYLVMEYVDGQRITDFVRERGASVAERLALFRQAAEAVRHAHRSLVVHRDLKPSNVLVTSSPQGGARGAVKLLDFGIAKLLEGDPSEDADLTRPGGRAFTPTYAPPEQEAGAPATTGFDVFALGVILHELLTGHKPIWRHGDAVAPSTVVSTVYGGQTPSASSAGLRPDHLRDQLKGDLDAILLKAVAQDPGERYPTVDALLEDLDRHAAGLPVHARRPTAWYRISRFAGRHRVGVLATAAVAGAVALGVVGIQRERMRAEAERDAAVAVASFLEGVFASANPVGQDVGADTLRIGDLLDRSVALAMDDLDGQPALRARMLDTFGRAYHALGDFERSGDLWAEAANVRRAASLPVPARTDVDLGDAAARIQAWTRADSLLERALAEARARGDEATSVHALAVLARAHLDRRKHDEAESALAELIPLARRVYDSARLAEALFMEGALRMAQGDPLAARPPLAEGIGIYRAVRGGNDPQVAIGSVNLAAIERGLGDLEAARTHGEEGLQILERRMPAGHPTVLAALNGLAATADREGALSEADSLYGVAAAWADRPGRENVLVQVYFNHAANRRAAQDTARALALSQAALYAARQAGGGAQLATPLLGVARAHEFAGDSAEAERFYAEAARVYGASAPPTYPGRIVADRAVARAASRAGRHAQAEQLMAEILERTPAGAARGSAVHRARMATLEALAAVYQRWGRADEEARVRRLRAEEDGPP